MPQVATQSTQGLVTAGIIILAGMLAFKLFGVLGGAARSSEITKQLRSLPVVTFFFGQPETEENTTQEADCPATAEDEDDFDYESIFGKPTDVENYEEP